MTEKSFFHLWSQRLNISSSLKKLNAERQKAERMAAKLRSLEIDPEEA